MFTALAQALHFPDYFGNNWDALYDVVCDFGWLQSRQIVIVHHDIPLLTTKRDAKIYLSILNDSVKSWKPEEDHELLAVFPTRYEKEIVTLLEGEYSFCQ